MKRKIALILSCLTLMSCLVIGASAKSTTRTKRNSEFGTLTGKQASAITSNNKRYREFITATTKTAPMLYITVDQVQYPSGRPYTCKSRDQKKNSKYYKISYSSADTTSITSYCAHEARGKSSLVVYTTLVNI